MKKTLKKIGQANRLITKKDLRSCMVLANYDRNHNPSFAAIAAPVSDVRRKGLSKRLCLEDPREKAFVALSENLLRRLKLRLPDNA